MHQFGLQLPPRLVSQRNGQPDDVPDAGHGLFEVGDLARVQLENPDLFFDVAGAAEAGEDDVGREDDGADGAAASVLVGHGVLAGCHDDEVSDVAALPVFAVVADTHGCGCGVEAGLEDWMLRLVGWVLCGVWLGSAG